jgi:hypothetical protein
VEQASNAYLQILKLRLNTCINPQSVTLAVAGKWQGLFNITECLAKKKE